MIQFVMFLDGEITANEMFEGVDVIDARYGYTNNIETLKKFFKDGKSHKIITNQTACLNNEYVWSTKYKVPRVLLRDKESGTWKEIRFFTERELRYAQSLEKLYRNGEFSDVAYKKRSKKEPLL